MTNALPIIVTFDQGGSFDVTLTADDFHVDMSGLHPPGDYHGEYEITPSADTQTMQTMNKRLSQNIIIKPIPNNYGLIGWDGSVLTVT